METGVSRKIIFRVWAGWTTAFFGYQSMQNQPYELFFILSPRRPFLTLLRESKNEMQVGLRFKK